MSATDRALMLGVRHRCGQEVQFWIPTYLVAPIIRELDEQQVLGLAGWMADEGLLADESAPPANLVEHLRLQMEPRDIAFIDVEQDASVCPSCGGLIPWVEAVTEYVASQNRREL